MFQQGRLRTVTISAYGPQEVLTDRKASSLRSVRPSLAADFGQLPVQPVAPTLNDGF
ncbi:hypothetical protein HanRHA438_Chr06g0254121 [Helianthus annuus]|nr:hypothetical protein HanRHA438_Chr06g0254121 [Helianthus annuus]